MMAPGLAAGLFAAGFVGGAMNAVAGGGSFAVFPALVAAGLPSRIANASTTVALLPGGLASVWAWRRDIASVGPAGLWAMAAVSFAGGAAGAGLLLATPATLFDRVVPWLLLFATVLLALGDRPRRAMERLDWRIGPAATLAIQGVLAVYGGYFGGAVGLMMLAVWGLVARSPMKTQLPARTVMVCTANAAAAIGFAALSVVAWVPTLVVLAGGLAGGYGGARLVRRLPPRLIRVAVLTVCVVTTATFFVRAYR